MFTVELICYKRGGSYSHFLECQDVRVIRKGPAHVVIQTWRDKESLTSETYLTHNRVHETMYNRAIVRNSAGVEIQTANTFEVTEEEARELRRELGLIEPRNTEDSVEPPETEDLT